MEILVSERILFLNKGLHIHSYSDINLGSLRFLLLSGGNPSFHFYFNSDPQITIHSEEIEKILTRLILIPTHQVRRATCVRIKYSKGKVIIISSLGIKYRRALRPREREREKGPQKNPTQKCVLHVRTCQEKKPTSRNSFNLLLYRFWHLLFQSVVDFKLAGNFQGDTSGRYKDPVIGFVPQSNTNSERRARELKVDFEKFQYILSALNFSFIYYSSSCWGKSFSLFTQQPQRWPFPVS